MAISEETKVIAKQKRNQVQQTVDALIADIAARNAANAADEKRITALKKEVDSLKKDIPDPTPSKI